MDRNALWPGVLADLELNLSPGNFATWIKPLSFLDLSRLNKQKQLLKLGCPSVFHKHQVGERYLGQIQAAAEKLLEGKCEIVLEIHQRVSPAKASATAGQSDDLFSVDTKKINLEAYQRAIRLLTEHRGKLEDLTKALLAEESLDGPRILQVTGLAPKVDVHAAEVLDRE